MNWYLQAWPMCGGDLYDDAAAPGCAECLMCGRSFDLPKVEAAKQTVRLPATVARRSSDRASPTPPVVAQDCCVCTRRIA